MCPRQTNVGLLANIISQLFNLYIDPSYLQQMPTPDEAKQTSEGII